MESKFIIVVGFIIIVIGMVGWVLFFFTDITGKSVLQWDPPVNSPAEIPEFSPFPDEPRLSPGEGPEVSGCDKAKISREFVCSIYEQKYPKGCGFFSGRCRGSCVITISISIR